MADRQLALTRDAFSVFRPLQTRWADNDCYGHMNNVVHYALFDTAINAYLIELDLLDIHNGEMVGLVVKTGCSYFTELAFPDRIEAGIRISKLGRSSITYEIALFRESETSAAAQGEFVHVYVERANRKPMPLTDQWRRTLEHLCHE